MGLFFLLLFPVAIGIAGFFLGKGKITPKELLVHEGVMLLVLGVGYAIALGYKSHDVEHWNGRIAKKWQGWQGCCHSYPCNCRTDDKGNVSCDICYLHTNDIYWTAETSNGENVYHDGCNAPGSSPPRRWNQIVVGEPTSVEHSFTNYIKGNPDSILRRQGVSERWKDFLPSYPRVYDYYRANKLIVVGSAVAIPDPAGLNLKLATINATLGPGREVNIILVVVATDDPAYAEALREHWIGGKKNDLVVVVGTPAFPQIAWASVMSWSNSEEMKLSIRDRIASLMAFDGDQVLAIIKQEVGTKFVRRHWEDFDYLRATITPSSGAMTFLFILGGVLSIGLQIFFWQEDPFGDGDSWSPSSSRFFGRRRRSASAQFAHTKRSPNGQ